MITSFKEFRHWRKRRRKTLGNYTFEDRRKNMSKLLIIIAGYKPFLYEAVFQRIKAFVPEMDVCIVSSGLYDPILSNIAQENNWSYLSLKRNCVTLAQNIVMMLHPKAEFIYKMDEDIFLTEGVFDKLMLTYNKAKDDGLYDISFVAPLTPINGYGHVRILEKLNLAKEYEQRFEKVKYASYPERMIESNPEVAKFFWGHQGIIPPLDEIARRFERTEVDYHPCPIRFSIGFILLPRVTWEKMGMWNVPHHGAGMGMDEVQICEYSIVNSQAMIISENAVVGHLSFGKQNEAMKDYFQEHPEAFKMR